MTEKKAGYYEFKDEKSNKFWEIEAKGKCVTVRYGKNGTAGRTVVQFFRNAEEARAHAKKLTAAKVKKGYKKARRKVSTEPNKVDKMMSATKHPNWVVVSELVIKFTDGSEYREPWNEGSYEEEYVLEICQKRRKECEVVYLTDGDEIWLATEGKDLW